MLHLFVFFFFTNPTAVVSHLRTYHTYVAIYIQVKEIIRDFAIREFPDSCRPDASPSSSPTREESEGSADTDDATETTKRSWSFLIERNLSADIVLKEYSEKRIKNKTRERFVLEESAKTCSAICEEISRNCEGKVPPTVPAFVTGVL